jgi:hypothetical protein
MQSIEREQNVTSSDEFGLPIASRCVRREGIVTRHVRMHNVNPSPPHESLEFVRARHVQSIAQRQSQDLL